MTLRLVFGCDPGIGGAIAALADGKVVAITDTPKRPRRTGHDEVNVSAMTKWVREVRAALVGAAELAVIEDVQPMPNKKDGTGMGATSAFQYGRTVQAFHDVFEILGVPRRLITAQSWKKAAGVPSPALMPDEKQRKDYSRTLVLQRHPAVADEIDTKTRGQPRSEAILMAEWGQRELGHEASVNDDPFGLKGTPAVAAP